MNWVELDPPRHLVVHTVQSIEILAADCVLQVVRTFRDSIGFQFWGSELYMRDMPLHDPSGAAFDRARTVLTERALEEFERRAAELNQAGTGDMAGFILKRA